MMLKTHSKRAYFHIFPTRNECKFFPDRKLVPLATLLLQVTSLETFTAWSKGLVSRFRGERRFSKGMISFTKDELDQKRRRNLTVVLDYYDAKEPYSRIGLLRSYGTLQSYWTTTKLWKLTVVLNYYEPTAYPTNPININGSDIHVEQLIGVANFAPIKISN